MTTPLSDLVGLPGAELVIAGLEDLRAGRESVESILVEIGAPRLRGAGIDVPFARDSDPERRLYRTLERIDSRGVHSRYNALIRRLISFEHAIEAIRGRERRRSAGRGSVRGA